MRSNLLLHRCWLHHVFFILILCVPAFAETKVGARKIVLLAGPITGHPKEAHEYEKSVILLKHLLDTSPNLKGLKTEAHFKGWPQDPSTLDNADTIVMISDGCDRKETDHPLYVGDRLPVIEKQMKRGCGFLQFHWTTFNPSRFHDQITEWSGGYFDYETGSAPNKWSSAIQTWTGPVTLGTPQHPITRGVKPFQLQEEFYYQIRFRENDPRLKPILLTRPPGVNQDQIVGWAVQRNDGGRGFGFTGGHFYKNWWLPDFRKLILNAVVWTAGIDVPEGGVESDLSDRIKSLVLTGYQHPAHDWRAVTAALIVSLEQDPRMIVHVTENIEDLATKKIQDYDLLVMNYNNWDRPGLSEAAKENFANYLKKGGGLAVIHFANGAFTDTIPNKESDWPEYRTKIVRRIWDHRPGKSGHDPFGPFQVEVTAVKHPITEGLTSFPTMDELYFLQAGELPIEPLATAHSKVTNHEEPMAWAYNYEAGRVFQTVLGHSDQSIRMAAALIRRGSVWAARRPQISFDPPVNLTEGALFRDGSQWIIENSLKAAGDKKKAQAPISPASAITNAAAKPVLPANPGLDEGGKYGHWGAEGEKDWVDNRWSRMDTGPFFSSSLQTPPGIALKALSIRVGEHDEAAVCFDAGQLSLKAGWIGKFIEPSPQRFGVIELPGIGGEIQFHAAEGPGWEDAPAHYGGLHLNGKRVVLDYTVGETKVLESPWFESVDDVHAFTRTLEHAASSIPHCLQIAEVKGAQGASTSEDRYSIVSLEKDSRITAVSVIGESGPMLKLRDQSRIILEFPSHNGMLRCKLFVWTGEKKKLSKFVNLVKQSAAPDDLTALSGPGPQRWPEAVITRGLLSSSQEAYVIDTLTVPYKNPNNALMFLSGHDFLDNGDAAVCTLHGDVWIVSGIDQKLDSLRWKRFATGLYQPLGLKVHNDQIYVLGRDQITRLHDLNADGEADFYESFYNHIKTSGGGHDYVTCLEADAAGSFYYADPHGLHRVSANGSSADTLATGWRNPNGMSVGPDGTITIAPQEGEWTPTSQISEVKRGGFYGFGGPEFAPDRPLGYDPPLCWIPRHIDNSSGGQVWVTSDRWGPLKNQLLALSFGKCSLMLVLRENAGGQPQGGVVPMKGRFPSGVIRGRFNPRDGQLYVTGLNGWVTSAVTDGCFSRVRYTGKPVYLPSALRIHSNGLQLTFTEPLNRSVAEDGESYAIQQWNYKWSAEYGSKEYSVKFPDVVGHDSVGLKSAKLSQDGRTVFLEIPALTPVMQMAIKYNLEAADGELIKGEIYNTINRLGSPLDIRQFASRKRGDGQ